AGAQREVRTRPSPDRGRLRLRGLRRGLHACLPAAPGPLQRDARADAGHAAQPAPLPAVDGAGACGGRLGNFPGLPGVLLPGARRATATAGLITPVAAVA